MNHHSLALVLIIRVYAGGKDSIPSAALTSSGTIANTLNTVISDISTLTALYSRFIYCTSCSK